MSNHSSRVGPDELWRFLPTQNIMWFYERKTNFRRKKKDLSQATEWCSGICWNQAHDKRRTFKTITEKLSRVKGSFQISTDNKTTDMNMSVCSSESWKCESVLFSWKRYNLTLFCAYCKFLLYVLAEKFRDQSFPLYSQLVNLPASLCKGHQILEGFCH